MNKNYKSIYVDFSLNRISPSKLSLCNTKEASVRTPPEQQPAGSDSSGSHKDEIRSISSEEFLAMERSTELDAPLRKTKVKEATHITKGRLNFVIICNTLN